MSDVQRCEVNTSADNRSMFERLPFELLSHIFELAMPEIDGASDIGPLSSEESPLSVSRVSRTLRDVALSSPRLWTRIFFSDVPTPCRVKHLLMLMDLSMARSNGQPLDLHVSMFIEDPGSVFGDDPCVSVLKKLMHERYRWRIVTLDVADCLLKPFLQTNDSTEPLLLDQLQAAEDLRLRIFHQFETVGSTIDLSNCLNLKNLLVDGNQAQIVLSLGRGPLNNLRSLTLRTSNIDLAVCLRTLAGMPSLEYCCIWTDYMVESGTLEPMSNQYKETVLPALTFLKVTLDRSHCLPTVRFLQHLTVPSLVHFSFEASASRYFVQDDCLRFGSAFLCLLKRSNPLLKVLALSASIPDETVINALHLLSGLEVFRTTERLSERLLRTLTCPYYPPHPTNSKYAFICPHLRDLQFEPPKIEQESLLDMLLLRVHASVDSRETTGAALSVTLLYRSFSDFQRMKRVMELPRYGDSLGESLVVNVRYDV